ncbi:RNA-directed RNA polymerase L [Gossypium arboreum]|uniref:RNA-directed RNA polymerase L n=1 Tax=Gossypium arboreum TaxID=29729 RepID=A0A0B0NQG6_GOSAR|nr:RNA-directed RNA polymerase L [Gossypium arboreum]KHG14069.1 RNA-directed RNA polymerase L [Gossypium arboreum]
MEKMGQRTKLTWPGLPHTGRPHGRVKLANLKHDLHGYNTCLCLSNRLNHSLKGHF